MRGAFITTFGIVITKLMGVLYVIPFHAIIGDNGGALYGYAYTVYLFFLSLSSAGIPLAISKVISEYHTLGYLKAKERAFSIGKKMALVLGLFFFLVITVFSPYLAKLILGDIVGGNSINDIAFVIRVISTAIVIVPLLSVYRGYFEGHRVMSSPSISQVLEQFFRVFIIIFGSLFALKVLKFKMSLVVGIALSGATVGCIISLIYLYVKCKNNKKYFLEKMRNVNEPVISNTDIIKKIILYAVPFIMIDVCRSLYNYIDMFTIVKGLVKYANYTIKDAEVIYSILSTWAQKFNMIISAISAGIIVNIIPNITELVIENKKEEIGKEVNLSISILLYFIVPMTLGICFLAEPIWILFYGYSAFGPNILSYYIFVGLVISIFTTSITILLTLKDYKGVSICLISGVFLKAIFNNMLCKTFLNIGFPAYYGYITATILGYIVSIVMCLFLLVKKYNINFEYTLKNFFDVLCASIFMIIILLIVHFISPIYKITRLTSVFIIILYSFIGMLIYFYYTYKSGVFKNIFGNRSLFKVVMSIIKKK